jgi:hypothetical protein
VKSVACFDLSDLNLIIVVQRSMRAPRSWLIGFIPRALAGGVACLDRAESGRHLDMTVRTTPKRRRLRGDLRPFPVVPRKRQRFNGDA